MRQALKYGNDDLYKPVKLQFIKLRYFKKWC